MHVGMCVQLSFPCPSMHISGALKKKKKKGQGLRAGGPTAPPLQGTGASGLGFGTWTERKEAQGPERRLQGR